MKFEYLDLKLFSKIGQISYGIYLVHMPLLFFIHDFFPLQGSPISFSLRLISLVLLTYFVSSFLELKVQPQVKKIFMKTALP